jgi:hypothetical protein
MPTLNWIGKEAVSGTIRMFLIGYWSRCRGFLAAFLEAII